MACPLNEGLEGQLALLNAEKVSSPRLMFCYADSQGVHNCLVLLSLLNENRLLF
jgi:hypothetical protein